MKECQHCKTCYADDVNACPDDGMPTLHTIAGEPVLEGKYHLESRVGQGGMGVVYKARHAYLKTLHAIKIILPDLVGNDPQLVQRFRQEALAAAAISHQNVVNVTDYGVAQGTMPFLVMEFVEGEDLHDFLDREKRLSPEKAFELTSAICKGIGAAHNQGIVHRDMKPLNIMLLKDKEDMSEAVKILDFGLAKIKSGELLGSFIQAQTTGLMGSPYYMAPEQWSDEELDARSDIYSIGVMLYQMLAGDVPFKGSSIPAIMKKHLTDSPPTFADMGVEIDPKIEAAVRRTLEKDRAKRTASVEDLIQELSSALGYSQAGINVTSSGGELPVSSLKVLTNPPESDVYVNEVAVGKSRDDGWLLLDGLQSGNHNLKVRHRGYRDWEKRVLCDGTPQQVVADLKSDEKPIEKPASLGETVQFEGSISQDTPPNLSVTHGTQAELKNTVHQNSRTVTQDTASGAASRSWFLSPLVLALTGILGLFLLTAFVGIGAYMSGFLGSSGPTTSGTPEKSATPKPEETKTKPAQLLIKNVIVEIPEGEFKMGRNGGLPEEAPEHKVMVKSFGMDKYEVTNAEYYEFAKATGYKIFPFYWEGGKPFSRDLNMPVRSVSYKEVQAFAKWRSERDGVTYRLPTEQEWEYAARSGGESYLYPWGNEFKKDCVVLDRKTTAPEAVGGRECGANKWGVEDLVGNVFEWTSSTPRPYPGSRLTTKKLNEPHYMIRGGSANFKSTGEFAMTSTFRREVKAKLRDQALGFRLVRSDR